MKPWVADGTICESCEREFVAGDLMAFCIDPPGTYATCSNPPTCAECVTRWNDLDPLRSWVQNLILSFQDGSSIEWVPVI